VLWNLLLGLVFLGANKYGDYITDKCPQADYACPKICDVDHKHLPIEECKNGKNKKSRPSKATIQTLEQLDEKAVGVHKPEGL
tara:strand:- start:13 stop:261 length:249 start_codon:yes stop_codon:yes gene_type:complete